MPGLRAHQKEHLFQEVAFFEAGDRGGGLGDGVSDVGEKLFGHFFWRQDIIHQSRSHRVAGHAIVFGRFGVLNHGHAAFTFDGPQSESAFGSRTREHNTNRPFFLILRQGPEKVVDGDAEPRYFLGLQQVQLVVHDGHVAVGRNHENRVRLHQHSVPHLHDLHFREAAQEIAQDALVRRIEVLNQDKGHAGVRRQVGEELLESLQTSGGCPNAHHVKPDRRLRHRC